MENPCCCRITCRTRAFPDTDARRLLFANLSPKHKVLATIRLWITQGLTSALDMRLNPLGFATLVRLTTHYSEHATLLQITKARNDPLPVQIEQTQKSAKFITPPESRPRRVVQRPRVSSVDHCMQEQLRSAKGKVLNSLSQSSTRACSYSSAFPRGGRPESTQPSGGCPGANSRPPAAVPSIWSRKSDSFSTYIVFAVLTTVFQARDS
jgi:hypothetical protein